MIGAWGAGPRPGVRGGPACANEIGTFHAHTLAKNGNRRGELTIRAKGGRKACDGGAGCRGGAAGAAPPAWPGTFQELKSVG